MIISHGMYKGKKRSRGAALGLVIASTVVIVLLILALFQMGMLMGGSRQVRNAVDAGVLNLSTRIMEVRVPVSADYRDVADSTGNVGLSNINRIWGKAYLVNANQESMQTAGQSTGASQAAAQTAFQSAQSMNNTLYGRLTDDMMLNSYFQQMSQQRQATFLNGSTIDKSKIDVCSVALVDRGGESNILMSPSQLPAGITPQAVQLGNRTYLKGYTPMQANSKRFYFATFRAGQMPHLISDSYFEQNRPDIRPTGSDYPVVPNAFKRYGEAPAAPSTLQAVAAAVANPQRQYTLAIPHAFVSIQIDNTAKWYVNGVKVSESTYGFRPQNYHQVVDYQIPVNGGILNGFASLGNEYQSGGNLMQAINALPGDHNGPLMKLVQRLQEIDPSFSLNRLKNLLASQTVSPVNGKYFLYPVYSTPDLTDPRIQIAGGNNKPPAWIDPANPPDGLQASTGMEPKQVDSPNTCWEFIVGGRAASGKHWTECSGNILWQPGTGYSQHLGELRFARLTEVYFTDAP